MHPRPCCACGFSYVAGIEEDERLHDRVHAEFLKGPVLPSLRRADYVGSVEAYTIVRVTDNSPREVRDDAAKLALVAHHSTPEYKAGYDGSATAGLQHVYVLLSDIHAIGFALVGDTTRSWRLRWQSANKAQLLSREADQQRRKLLARVWLAFEFRRRGVGYLFVHHIAAGEGTDAGHMTFQLPLSPDGIRLVQRLVPSEWFADGDAFELDGILE